MCTDGDRFSAAERGTCRAQYDEMGMADQPQQKLNNTVRRPFPISQSAFLFSFFFLHDTLQTISTSPDSTIIIHSPSSALHLGSRSILFISPTYFPLLTYFLRPPPPLLVPDLKRTPRQTAEQSNSQDQTFVLNYNPSK